jgi:AcrR family transcriptional regulator
MLRRVMNDDSGHNTWIDAGLKEIGQGGVAQVRVEVLAKRLGVTKGGFYRRFKDRRALLDALLETWTRGRVAANEQQIALGNEKSAADGLKAVIRLHSERVNPEGLAIELAIRQWARSDRAAAAAVARVDTARLRGVEQQYVRMGLSREDAQARALLFYAFIFGQGLMFPGEAPRHRATLIAGCADVLLSVKRGE